MDASQITELPTTIVGLVAFMTAAQLALVGIFLRYIIKKNGNLDRAINSFDHILAEQRISFERMLLEMRNK